MGDLNAICWRQNRCYVVPIATLLGVRVEKKRIDFMLGNVDLHTSKLITVVKELRNPLYNPRFHPVFIICTKQDKSIAAKSQTDGKLLEIMDFLSISVLM